MTIQIPFFFPNRTFRSPYGELERMRQDMGRLMEGFGGKLFRLPTAGVFPLVNLTEDNEAYYIRAEIPGVKPDELDISTTGSGKSSLEP